MTKEEFVLKYNQVISWTKKMNDKARREGLLSLEEELEGMDDAFLKRGLRLIVDGTDPEFVGKILSNLVAQEKDEYTRTIKTMQKEAILMMQFGVNTLLILNVLNSYTDIPFNEDEVLGSITGHDDDSEAECEIDA